MEELTRTVEKGTIPILSCGRERKVVGNGFDVESGDL